jgi:hypothetical protein
VTLFRLDRDAPLVGLPDACINFARRERRFSSISTGVPVQTTFSAIPLDR